MVTLLETDFLLLKLIGCAAIIIFMFWLGRRNDRG